MAVVPGRVIAQVSCAVAGATQMRTNVIPRSPSCYDLLRLIPKTPFLWGHPLRFSWSCAGFLFDCRLSHRPLPLEGFFFSSDA